MDVLALILACSLHPDDDLLRALVEVQSGGNVYFVGDLSTLKTNDSLSTAVAALQAAEDLVRHGGRPAVGLLGIPLDWATRFGLAPLDLFDACTNIAVGSAVLADYQDRCSSSSVSRHQGRDHKPFRRHGSRLPVNLLRVCLLTRLSKDLGVESAPTVVLNAMTKRRGPGSATQDQAPQTSPIFRDRNDDSIYLDGSESPGAGVFTAPSGSRF